MLKRVFPDRQHKGSSSSRNTKLSSVVGTDNNTDGNRQSPIKQSSSNSTQLNSESNSGGSGNSSGEIIDGTITPNSSSANSSPQKNSIPLTSASRHTSSSSSSSPVKSESHRSITTCEYRQGGGAVNNAASELSKLRNISRSCSSTEFQSLKLESMSTVEEFKSVSKTISSSIERDGMLTKQSSVPLGSGNDGLESTSLSTPSDEDGENDPAESLFKHQAKFFCQMKDYLLSHQSSLRQHLELLNATVASRKKKATARRQQRFLTSGHSVHLAAKPKPEVTPEIRGNNNQDLDLNEFHSCSSTEKSDDDIQVCPLCGVEIEDSENPTALEEHVASHWCSPDDPI